MHKITSTIDPFPQRLLLQLSANLGLGILYSVFAYSFLQSLKTEVRLSAVLALITVSLDAVLFLIRRFPRSMDISPYAWSSAAAGSCIVFLLRPAGAEDLAAGTILQLLGFLVELLALVELRRSFGLVPANRGIKQQGAYRFVRHPLYLGSLIFFCGFLINHCSLGNALLALTLLLLTLIRMGHEERLLSREPEYVVYKCRVPWRLLPGVY